MTTHRRLLMGASGGGVSFVIPPSSTPTTDALEALYNGTIDGGTTYAIGAATFDGTTWTKNPGNPLIVKGASGLWDEDGVKDPALVWDGSQYVCYYAGYTYTGGDPGFQIGRAVAPALGGAWTKYASNPVVATGGGVTDAEAPIVFYDATAIGGHAWWMWYIENGTTPKLRYSDDGLTWTMYGTVTAAGPVAYVAGTFYMLSTNSGLNLYTFTTPTGTYTADSGNPQLRARSSATHISAVLSANASAAATSISVASGALADLQLGEPLFIVDGNSGPEITKVTSVGSTSIGVTALATSYQTADGATARSMAYTIIDARSIRQMTGGTWEAFGTTFRPGDGLTFSGNALWEGSLRYTAPAATGPWSFDWTTGLIFPLTSLGAAWDSVSAENMSVIAAAGGGGGGGGGGGNPTFLTRPSSGVIVFDSTSDVIIENLAIDGGSVSSPSGIGISVSNVHNLTIRDMDLANLVGGMYLYNITGTLTITNVRSRNIGDGTIGSGHSNHIQLAESFVSGTISGCKFLGGRTEDMFSIYRSGGINAGSPLIIENNELQGLIVATADARAWTSSSGTGIIIGDGPGSSNNGYVTVRNNTLLNPGQVGIQHIDGPGLSTHDNIIVAQPYGPNNNPLTAFAGNPGGSAVNNTYDWQNNDLSRPTPFNGAGTMTFSGNTSDPSLNPADYVVVL